MASSVREIYEKIEDIRGIFLLARLVSRILPKDLESFEVMFLTCQILDSCHALEHSLDHEGAKLLGEVSPDYCNRNLSLPITFLMARQFRLNVQVLSYSASQ